MIGRAMRSSFLFLRCRFIKSDRHDFHFMGINMDRVVSLATVSVSARWEGAKTSCLWGCRQWGTEISAHFPRQMHHGIKSAHGDALPTFTVCCSISSKSWITVAFKRSFFILTLCVCMTVMKTILALVYIYNTIRLFRNMKVSSYQFQNY